MTFSCGAQAPGLSRGESAASWVCAILAAAVASWDALRTIPPPHPSSASGSALPSRKAEPAGAGADARCASPAGRENPLASAMGSVKPLLLALGDGLALDAEGAGFERPVGGEDVRPGVREAVQHAPYICQRNGLDQRHFLVDRA